MLKNWRELTLMLVFGYLGLGFPDIDREFLSILHHRSILTHSILLPAIVLLGTSAPVRFGACGFTLGIAIHLSADVMSSPTGFGMIWLPWPAKFTLGALSPVWMAANAIVGLIWVQILLLKVEQRSPLTLYVVMAVVLASSYAVFHERSLFPLAAFAVIFCLSTAITLWIARQSWFHRLPGR